MSVPKPAKPLDGRCSTVVNGVLYVLSSDSFQSVSLKPNGTWNTETNGVPVTGAACAKVSTGADDSQASLFVIGGSSKDDSYSGLQRYSFANKTWETLQLPVNLLKGRQNHTATYLPGSGKVVVYAGSQPESPSYYSSQTFTILAQSPYTLDSYTGPSSHTANLPILAKWDDTHALMAGGTTLDNSVYLFEPGPGWTPLGVNLSQPSAPGVKGTLISGTDGSKVLNTYDLSSSPNKVTQNILLQAGGQLAQSGQTVGGSGNTQTKRDLTLQNWPTYNSTNAPSAARSDYSLTQNDQGLAVIAGGNSDASLAMFNQTGNSWVDASKFFGGSSTSSSSSSMATSTSAAATSAAASTPASTPAATSAAASAPAMPLTPDEQAAADQKANLNREGAIIGGVIGGLAVIFILLLLCLRRRSKKKEARGDDGQGGRMSFADRGASFMREAEGSVHGLNARSNNHHLKPAPAPGPSSHLRSSQHAHKASYESTNPLVRNREADFIRSEPMELRNIHNAAQQQPRDYEQYQSPIMSKPAPAQLPPVAAAAAAGADVASLTDDDIERRNRSSGWSRYFAATQPTDNGLSHIPSAYRKPVASDGSHYSDAPMTQSRQPPLPQPHSQNQQQQQQPSSQQSQQPLSRIPSSTLMPALSIDFGKSIAGQRLSTVASGSPSLGPSQDDLTKRGSTAEAQKAFIEDKESTQRISGSSTGTSSYDRATMRSSTQGSDDYRNSTHNHGAWTPMTTSFKDHVNGSSEEGSRPTSSLYAQSLHDKQHAPSRSKRGPSPGFFPGSGTSAFKVSKPKMSHTAAPSADWATVKDEELTHPPRIGDRTRAADSRDSAMTVFPEQQGGLWTATTKIPIKKNNAPTSMPTATDMSDPRDSTATMFPQDNGSGWTAGHSNAKTLQQQPSLASLTRMASQDRESSLTLFPRAVPSSQTTGRPKMVDVGYGHKKAMDQDVNWLNNATMVGTAH